jgi:hypothetical protein
MANQIESDQQLSVYTNNDRFSVVTCHSLATRVWRQWSWPVKAFFALPACTVH